jgi:hypothetical protein
MVSFTPQAHVTDGEAALIEQRLSAIYAQDIARLGGRLDLHEVDRMDFAAFASRAEDGRFVVELYKGLRYHRLMTLDTYTLIACHELGHHAGGVPFFTARRGSVEGEADYFANLKCMRRYLGSLPNAELFAQPAPELALVARCQKEFSGDTEVQICARSLRAARDLGLIALDVEGSPGEPEPSLDRTDNAKATVTFEEHASSQCRTDTYKAGALCPVSWREDISSENYTGGVCHRERVPEFARPACWFAEPVNQLLGSL